MFETVKDEAWRQTVCLCMLNLTCEKLKSVEHHTGPAATVKCSSAHKKLQIFFGYQDIDQNNVQKQLLPYSLKLNLKAANAFGCLIEQSGGLCAVVQGTHYFMESKQNWEWKKLKFQ